MTTRDRRSIRRRERDLLSRLLDKDADDRWSGLPPLNFRPHVHVLTTPPAVNVVATRSSDLLIRPLGYGIDIGRRVDARSMRGVLTRFIDLWDADVDTIAAFAEKHGSLDLCPCGQPLGDRTHMKLMDDISPGIDFQRWAHAREGAEDATVPAHLRRHIAPAAVLELSLWTPRGRGLFDRVPCNRLSHLVRGSSALRVERVEHWRRAARLARAFTIACAFVLVALDDLGREALIDPKKLPGFEDGLPFVPDNAAVPLETLMAEIGDGWLLHENRVLSPSAICLNLLRETNKRLSGTVSYRVGAVGCDGVVDDFATADYVVGADAPTLSAHLALAFAGMISRAVSPGRCRAPNCRNNLKGRQTLVCSNVTCRRWASRERQRRRRA